MSIAVMNWIWANSPTSGNQRLVLLALADACSQDDGTGCWPSVPTIARKANISERTVQRVITQLEKAGHLVVHRGAGPRGTNTYTVIMRQADTPQPVDNPVSAVHSPRHNDGGDSLSAVTQLRHPTPDSRDTPGVTPVSPEPPRTIIEPPPPSREPEPAVSTVDEGGGGDPAGEFFTALGEAWPLSTRQRARLAPLATAAIVAGWTPKELASHVGANTDGVRNPYAVLHARLQPAELPEPSRPPTPAPPWCGRCSPNRWIENVVGHPVRPCPQCHPRVTARHHNDRLLTEGTP